MPLPTIGMCYAIHHFRKPFDLPPYMVMSCDVTSCWGILNRWQSSAQLSRQTTVVVKDMHHTVLYFSAKILTNTSTNTHGRTRHQNPKYKKFQILGLFAIFGAHHTPSLHFDAWRNTQNIPYPKNKNQNKCFDFLFYFLLHGGTKGLTTHSKRHVRLCPARYYSQSRENTKF